MNDEGCEGHRQELLMEPSCFSLLVNSGLMNSSSLIFFLCFCLVLVPAFDRGKYGIFS